MNLISDRQQPDSCVGSEVRSSEREECANDPTVWDTRRWDVRGNDGNESLSEQKVVLNFHC
jgi:hypothetical protein